MTPLNRLSPDADNLPPPINRSHLFLRSIGRAANNIDDCYDPWLEVLPIEEVGYIDGEVSDNLDPVEAQGIDAEGNAFSVKIQTSNTIRARWLPIGSNRISTPNVRRGERVFLFQYGDTDQYYWSSMGMDEEVRRNETVVFRVANTQDESDQSIGPHNSYWAEMCTQRKHITLSTSKNDGEAFAYTVQIDAKNGRLTVCDDADNFIEIDSPASKITLCNKEQSFVQVDKQDIRLKAGNSITMDAPTVKIKASSTTITSGSTSIEGGSATMNGTYNVLGAMNFKGAVTSNGKDISSNHKHKDSGGPGDGGPVA